MHQWRQLYEYEKPQCVQVLSISHFRCQTCKDAIDPSGESWKYLSSSLSCNIAEIISYTTFRDLVLDFQTCLCFITFFVSECSTYSLSLPSMSKDHDSNQVMKFLYMRSDWSLSVLNKGLKLELHLLRQICVYVLNSILYVLNNGSVKWALR